MKSKDNTHFFHAAAFCVYNLPMEKKEYTVTPLAVTPRTSEELLTGNFNGEILSRMERIVATEAPIREGLLFKRVLNSYSLERNGRRLSSFLSSLSADLDFPVTEDADSERVFHLRDGDADYFRPTPDSSVRYSYQIPSAEAASCLIYILIHANASSYTKSALKSLFIAEMGYEKSGERIDELYERALQDPRIRRSANGRIMKDTYL